MASPLLSPSLPLPPSSFPVLSLLPFVSPSSCTPTPPPLIPSTPSSPSLPPLPPPLSGAELVLLLSLNPIHLLPPAPQPPAQPTAGSVTTRRVTPTRLPLWNEGFVQQATQGSCLLHLPQRVHCTKSQWKGGVGAEEEGGRFYKQMASWIIEGTLGSVLEHQIPNASVQMDGRASAMEL